MAPAFEWLLLLLVTVIPAFPVAGSTALAGSPAVLNTSAGVVAATSLANDGPTVKILAVFDQADMETMTRVMQKTLIALNKAKTAWSNDSSSSSRWGPRGSPFGRKKPSPLPSSFVSTASLKVDGVAFSVQWWLNQSAEDLSLVIKLHRPAAVLALSSDERSVFRVSLSAAAHNLPVIGTRAQRGLDDSSFQGVSPLYVGLNPGPSHLAAALRHLLLANDWLPVTLIVDDSLEAQAIRRAVLHSYTSSSLPSANTTSSAARPKVAVVTMNRGSSARRILAQLSGIQQTESLVVAFCCEPRLATRLYREARRLNMLNGDWVWLALEQAAGRSWSSSSMPPSGTRHSLFGADWPLGLLGLVSQQPLRITKHTMKGSLAILHSSLKASLPVHQLQSWLSDWSAIDVDSSSTAKPGVRLQMAKKLHSEIRWRVKEALAGRLTYDGGGKIDAALRANFDIINLVAPGPFYPSGSSPYQQSRLRPVTFSPQPSSSRQRRLANYSVAVNHPSQSESEEQEEMPEEEGPEENNDEVARTDLIVDPIGQLSTNNNQRIPFDQSLLPVWQSVGNVSGQAVTFKGVQWPGGGLAGPRSHSRRVYRVATVFSPPFVMETEVFKEDNEEQEEQRCLTGVPCLRVATAQKDELARIFGDYEGPQAMAGKIYNLTCCYGYSIDLMENLASDLDVKFQVYVVADGQCGAKRASKWDGIVADLRSGAAHLSFAPLSVTSGRSEVIDFSIPYFYSGLSILEATKTHDDVPLLAFLKPFSFDLWIGIFISLNVTALAVAVYEWLSPFGLNPWGRQRTKNFSLASALWVMWGLLFSHLVAFKAPKSWPNKFLINVWGGFSVIFLASYTANIAALFAGVFSETAVTNFHDPRLLSQKVGTTRSSAADHYALKTDRKLWEHLQKFTVPTLEEGVQRLRDGRLDLLIGDTPILDYYRANDPGCTLRTVDVIEEDNYAVGLTKGLHLQTSISSLISSYSTSGYMDELRSKWYSSLPCSRSANDAYRPQPLGVSAVAGVFILLGFGILAGCLILILEHLVYKYALPGLRRQPKGTIWRSPNMMFFSQKLYRFINCVELLSPHHAAKELMHSLRQGQITSLFQKSVKRKEIEQKRRRKSKAQFFEMIREVRRYQREEREIAEQPGEDDEEAYKGDDDDDDDEGNNEDDCCIRIPESALSSAPVEVIVKVDGDSKPSSSAGPSNALSGRDHTKPGSLKHSMSTVTDPGTVFLDNPLAKTSAENEKKWKQVTRRRRSFSADALCNTDMNRQHRKQQVQPADLPFVDSSSSSSSSDESPTEGDSNSDDDSSLLCSMVDRATLHRLTKDDVLLLWQAAEDEWLIKVRTLRKERDILQLRYQHARTLHQLFHQEKPFPAPSASTHDDYRQ